MASFEFSDYMFNSVFYQAYSQRFQYSAADLLSNSTKIHAQLALNCTAKSTTGSRRKLRVVVTPDGGVKSTCIGSIFENNNDSTGTDQQFHVNATSDLIYRSDSRAPSIIVVSKGHAYFDASNSVLEILGPIDGQDHKRRSLGRAEIRVLRGDFVPKFDGTNVTGSIEITNLEFGQSTFNGQSRKKLIEFARPLLTEMFSAFLERYAQFPLPLLDGFKCMSPDFMINRRSMQVDCDFASKGYGSNVRIG
jgi:hypothetical protein